MRIPHPHTAKGSAAVGVGVAAMYGGLHGTMRYQATKGYHGKDIAAVKGAMTGTKTTVKTGIVLGGVGAGIYGAHHMYRQRHPKNPGMPTSQPHAQVHAPAFHASTAYHRA